MKTLQNLIDEFGANGLVIGQAGNGSAIAEAGEFFAYDDAMATSYGNVQMHALAQPHISNDNVECGYASHWITEGTGDNPFRIRLYF